MSKSLTRWPPPELAQIETALTSLKSDLEDALRGDNDALARWMTQLLVIKSAGYIEQVALLAARAHISTLGWGTVRSYGLARIERFFGPKPEDLLQFVGRFDAAWRAELESLLDDDDQELRREISALLSARDQIAHGRSHNVGPVAAFRFHSAAETIAAWMQLRLNPL